MLFAFSDYPNNPNYSENNRKMVDFLKHIYTIKNQHVSNIEPVKRVKNR